MRTALITGVSGQDGTYLAEYLVARGYRVVGVTRDASAARRGPLARSLDGVDLLEDGLDSPDAVTDVLRRVGPDEVYHLAGPSRVSSSWSDPEATRLGVLGPTGVLLDAVQAAAPAARCFFAGSCEMHAAEDRPQDESAPRRPTSPYGVAKLQAFERVRAVREAGSLFAATGILFNHESPRRGESFVSRKIASGVAAIARGGQREMRLGDLTVRRDWGFAGDFVRAMWAVLQQDDPEDLVIGTGVAHSVAEFCDVAFRAAGLEWTDHVVSDPALFRTADAPLRLADPGRARRRLGWSPEVDFHRLVSMMVGYEMGDGRNEMGVRSHPTRSRT